MYLNVGERRAVNTPEITSLPSLPSTPHSATFYGCNNPWMLIYVSTVSEKMTDKHDKLGAILISTFILLLLILTILKYVQLTAEVVVVLPGTRQICLK